MIESALMQAGFKLVMAIAAVLVARGTLTWMDRVINNVSFRETLENAAPDHRLYYFGARYLGTCILVGLVIS